MYEQRTNGLEVRMLESGERMRWLLRMWSFIRVLPGLICLLSVVASGVVVGQEVRSEGVGGGLPSQSSGPSLPLQTGGSSGGVGGGSAESGAGGAELLLRTESGELVPLRELLGADVVQGMLQRADAQRLPGYWIARLEMRGVVTGEVVDLDMELQVVVRASSEWVSVPLAFGEVYLTDFSHETSVSGGESVLGVVEQNQRRWSLRGVGLHRLKFHLTGKTRAGGPGVHQLSLTLPEAAASHAVLDFSVPVELQRIPAGAVDRQTRDERGVRSVELVGLSGAAQFAWLEVAPAVTVKPVVQVQNRMKLDLTTIPASLSGTQQLQITGAGLSEVRVRWPKGFELKEVQVRNAANVSVLNNFEVLGSGDAAVDAVIRLTGAADGPLLLEYGLELSNRSFPQDIRMSLPVVEGANVQTGDLDLVFPAGMLVQQTQVVGAQRRRVTAESDAAAAATAFRLRSVESYVEVHVEEMAAQYAVTTDLTVRPQGGAVVLGGDLRVSVLRGALLELVVDWQSAAPGSEWSEWSLLPGGARLVRDSTSIPLTPEMVVGESGSGGYLRFVFPERQSGEFSLEFQAVSELPGGGSGGESGGAAAVGGVERRLLLSCPQVRGQRGQAVVLRTQDSDEYQAELLNAKSGERLRGVPVVSVSRGVVGTEESGSADGLLSWVHDQPEELVWIRLTPQRQLIRASVTAGLSEAAGGLDVQELIELEVLHRDISEVTLVVPDSVQPVVRAAGIQESLRAVIVKANEWTFRLPQATRGVLQLEVRWLHALSGEMNSGGYREIDLPLVFPRDARVWRLQAGTNESSLAVREDVGWEPIYSERYDSAWRNPAWGVSGAAAGMTAGTAMSGGASSVSLPLRYRRSATGGLGAAPMFVMTESRVFSGQTLTSSSWYFERVPTRLVLTVPGGLSLEALVLGERLLTGESGLLQARELPSGGGVEWEVLPRALREAGALGGGPVVLKARVRQSRGLGQRWLGVQLLERVRLQGETESTVLVWLVRPQEGLRGVISNSPLGSISAVAARIFSSESGSALVSGKQLEAILSGFPQEVRELATVQGREWLAGGRHELCFGSGSDLKVRLSVVPESMLYLVTAAVCLGVFVFLTLFSRLPVGLPIPLGAAVLAGAWVISPEWSGLLLPWSGAGVLGGVFAGGLQRWALLRRYGVSPMRQVMERPTVFGFPNYVDAGIPQLQVSGGGSSVGQAEAAAG
ncbi:MAG: hypothetical protein RLZZ458_385 [Planctomycetota bacterium]